MSERVKEIIGEELYKQVTEKIKPEEIDIVKDNYVPLTRFNEINKELKANKGKIKDYEKQKTEYETLIKDHKDIKDKYDVLNEKHKNDLDLKDKEIANITKYSLVKEALIKEKAIYPDTLLKEINLDDVTVKDGKLENFTDKMTGLKKDFDKMFIKETSNSTPPEGSGEGEKGDGFNIFDSLLESNQL